uniref:NADH-ubiquinone oxidoreductase MWFE subunit n=1 Tax=Ascaris lumbricoides TaxID=6252 RepID=A0A0M3I5K7_ASCLU
MWYEQFYSGAVTIFFIWGACMMSYPFNLLDVKRPFRRNYGSVNRIQLSQRDHRLTGNQYVISGLESIPDM